jgi:putative addiction module CopG family antidote
MGYALAGEQQCYVAGLVRAGRFNNQSEVVREALRRMQAQDQAYLTPPPLTPAQVAAIYGTADPQADRVGRAQSHTLERARFELR